MRTNHSGVGISKKTYSTDGCDGRASDEFTALICFYFVTGFFTTVKFLLLIGFHTIERSFNGETLTLVSREGKATKNWRFGVPVRNRVETVLGEHIYFSWFLRHL